MVTPRNALPFSWKNKKKKNKKKKEDIKKKNKK